jgi:hypothetical protein
MKIVVVSCLLALLLNILKLKDSDTIVNRERIKYQEITKPTRCVNFKSAEHSVICSEMPAENQISTWTDGDELRNPVNIKLFGIFADTFWTSLPYHESGHHDKIWPVVIVFVHRYIFNCLISLFLLELFTVLRDIIIQRWS